MASEVDGASLGLISSPPLSTKPPDRHATPDAAASSAGDDNAFAQQGAALTPFLGAGLFSSPISISACAFAAACTRCLLLACLSCSAFFSLGVLADSLISAFALADSMPAASNSVSTAPPTMAPPTMAPPTVAPPTGAPPTGPPPATATHITSFLAAPAAAPLTSSNNPAAASAADAAIYDAATAAAASSAAPGTLAATLELLEARAQGAASLAALSAHAAQLETQVRAQSSASARAEAARAEAVARQAALAHDVATLTQEKQRITAQLDHYMGRADELLVERGVGAQQLAELARTLAAERDGHQTELAALREHVAALEAAAAEGEAARSALEQQNTTLNADLREVTQLIDQLEGEPGYVRSRLRRSPSPQRKQQQERAAAEAEAAAAEAQGLRAEVDAMRTSLAEREAELESLRGAPTGGEEMALLREENRILESQLELISEKMYATAHTRPLTARSRLTARSLLTPRSALSALSLPRARRPYQP